MNCCSQQRPLKSVQLEILKSLLKQNFSWGHFEFYLCKN